MKLYPIKDSQDYFRAGVSPTDGVQAVFFRQAENAICLKFAADGRLLGSESKLLSNPENDETRCEEIENWMAQLGFNPSTIHVQKFAIPRLAIEIRDLPYYLQEYVDSPAKFPQDRQEHLSRRVDEWRRDGGFVLIWDEEYEMSAEGDVDST